MRRACSCASVTLPPDAAATMAAAALAKVWSSPTLSTSALVSPSIKLPSKAAVALALLPVKPVRPKAVNCAAVSAVLVLPAPPSAAASTAL